MYVNAQVQLTIENIDTVLTTYVGYDIPRSTPTNLIFRKNNLNKTSTRGYILRCGDDSPAGNNNNLDGAIIQGNKLFAVPGGSTHGMMLGFNVDYDVKHNYVSNADYGLVIEGDTGMAYSSGGIAYNIITSNRTFGILLFGPDSVKIYNNTFYSNRQRSTLGILRIETNSQHGYDITTSGTKIKNNIFYAENDVLMIAFDSTSAMTLDCDYNLYYSEAGYPIFRNTTKGITYHWDEWRALGFDNHSVVLNPRFISSETLVPTVRVDFGTNLGSDFNCGLASTAEWMAGEYPDTIQQNKKWQVGAIVLDSTEYVKVLDSTEHAKQVNLFPSPNDGLFLISVDGFEQNEMLEIRLISLDGKSMYIDSMVSDEKMKQLDLSHISPGIYLIQLLNEHSTATEKFIKLNP